MKYIFFIVILLFSLNLGARDWTIILYSSLDKDPNNVITEYLLDDLKEMQKVDDKKIKFIVAVDKWYELKWKSTDQKDKNGHVIYKREGQSFGEWGNNPVVFDVFKGRYDIFKLVDEESGSKDNIISVVTWAVRDYPADNYLLVFDGHGNGSMGGFGDVKVAELGETMEQLKIFLKKELDEEIFKKLKVISFASCLMNTLAVNYEVRKDLDYVTGSEHPSYDTHYDNIAKEIIGKGPKDAALSVVKNLDSPTASAINLKILRNNTDKSLYSSLSLFVKNMIDVDDKTKTKYMKELHKILEKVQRFDKSWFELVDLHHFFKLISESKVFSNEIKDIAKRILFITKPNAQFVIKNEIKEEFMNSDDRKYLNKMKNANGISIYFPIYKTENVAGIEGEAEPYNFEYFKKLSFCVDTKYSWDKLIDSYYKVMKNSNAKRVSKNYDDEGDEKSFWQLIFGDD